jgi:hypothetical protein
VAEIARRYSAFRAPLWEGPGLMMEMKILMKKQDPQSGDTKKGK